VAKTLKARPWLATGISRSGDIHPLAEAPVFSLAPLLLGAGDPLSPESLVDAAAVADAVGLFVRRDSGEIAA
jgi:hypothetical protein